jgi:hypothetical protein
VLRHPALSILAAVVVIGGAGALIDTLGGPSATGESACSGPVRAPRGEQQRDATLEYRRLWLRAAPLLGSAGQPPPRLRFVGPQAPGQRPGEVMWVGPDRTSCRTIFIAPGARRLLARAQGDRRTRRHHRAAQRWVLHETAHYFQSDAVLGNVSLREFGATEWEKAHSPAIIGTGKQKVPVPFNQWRDRDQFGSNYGGNPRTFGWPVADLAAGPRPFR